MSKPSEDTKKFDVRCQERNIKYAVTNRGDLERYLDALPDVAHKAITLGEIDDRSARLAASRPGN